MASIDYYNLSPERLSLFQLYQTWKENRKIKLSTSAIEKINECRTYLEEKIEKKDTPNIYGINTGLGSLCDITIEEKDLETLQENMIRSHACGIGKELQLETVRLMLLLKVRSLSLGHSGIRMEIVERLIDLYNNDILPVVYEQGSLGASGDLAPLAHLSLPLLGEGMVNHKGEKVEVLKALRDVGLTTLTLRSKEGLALLNGTQFMSSLGCQSLFKGLKLSYLADLIGTLSLEGFDGRPEPFNALIHKVRPHKGQEATAAQIRGFLNGSKLISKKKSHTQDPYSFRCISQIHGASKDVLYHVAGILSTEINSVTDNPTIFPDEDVIISGGNFHGQTLAISLDLLAIALAELANISERRTYLLMSGQRSLPEFLIATPGLNSGLMIAQYTSASIVSQNKQLCTPASVDSITSSNGQEDHVSMGANAATKVIKVVDNLETVLAIELLTASQALFFRKDKASPFLQSFLQIFREKVPFIDKDRILSKDIASSKNFIHTMEIESKTIFNGIE